MQRRPTQSSDDCPTRVDEKRETTTGRTTPPLLTRPEQPLATKQPTIVSAGGQARRHAQEIEGVAFVESGEQRSAGRGPTTD